MAIIAMNARVRLALSLGGGASLFACALPIPGLPTIVEAPPASVQAFPDFPLPATAPTAAPGAASPGSPSASGSPAPGGVAGSPTPTAGATPAPQGTGDPGPFGEGAFSNRFTTTKFAPVVLFSFDALRQGAEPGLTLDVYQTAGEVEIGETQTLLEGAGFRFDKLTKGLVIGGGRMDVGTPPKATFSVTITVDDTDSATFGVFSVKATGLGYRIYLADIRARVAKGNLQISSIANMARANDAREVYATEKSARVVQTFFPGYVVLPRLPAMRVRWLMYGMPDHADQLIPIRTELQTLGLAASD